MNRLQIVLLTIVLCMSAHQLHMSNVVVDDLGKAPYWVDSVQSCLDHRHWLA